MASQVTNGKSFEWAVGLALQANGLLLKENDASWQINLTFLQ